MKKFSLGLLITLALLAFSGCGNDRQELNVTYQKGTVSFEDVYGVDSYNNSKELGTIATAEHITYYFAAELSEAQIEEYVKETNQLILQLEEEANIDNRKYDIYVCNVDYVTTVDEDTLYISYSNLGNLEHVRGIAQLLYGNETNYGLLYGYAASFAKEYGFDVEADGLEEALKLRNTNPEYLDMNYACFNDHYVEQENIEKLQVIAVNYYSYLEKNKKTELLKNFSDEKHREYFNDFLEANGVEAYDNSDLDGIYVYAGGNGAELIWTDNVGTYYLEEGFEPNYLHKFFEADLFNSGYANFRELMLDYQAQRQFLADKFDEMDAGVEPLVIAFIERGYYSRGYSGSANINDDTIQVYMLANLQQIYTQKMLYQEGWGADWLFGCVESYYTDYPGETEANYFGEYMANSIKECKENPEQNKEFYEWVMLVEEHLGHSLDLSQRDDFIYFYTADVAYGNLQYLPMSGKNSWERVVFTDYLVDLAGEENAIKAMISGDAEGTFGKSWEELQDEWVNSVRTEFEWALPEE